MLRKLALCLALTFPAMAGADPLPSWNDTDATMAIEAFVDSVTDPKSQTFVPEADRIAVFDNDGTLWSEQPLYFQALYALDRLREKAEADPSILSGSPVLKAAVEGDQKALMESGEEGLLEILDVTHAGITVPEFQDDVRDWLAHARHPVTGLPYTGMTYQPMVELLSYLRENHFKTYIVSGGGIDFIRAFAPAAYGIPPEQVIGSEGTTLYELHDGVPVLSKEGGVSFVDDGAGKPVGIQRFIGRKPIFVAGNSDGDFDMMEWITSGPGPHLGVLIHHTDAEREYAYDRGSHIGKLEMGLDQAEARGWITVDMAKDWSRIWTGRK